MVDGAVLDAPPFHGRNADGIGQDHPLGELLDLCLPSALVAFGPSGASDLCFCLRIGQMNVQDPDGVVVQREELFLGVVIVLDFLVCQGGVQPALDIPRLVGVDQQAPTVGLQGLLQVVAFALEVGLGLREHDMFTHPTVDDPLRKGRAVFQGQIVGNPLGQTVPCERFAIRRCHHIPAKRCFLGGGCTVARHPHHGHHPPHQGPGLFHFLTRLYSASRLMSWGYLRRSSMIHSFSKWSW